MADAAAGLCGAILDGSSRTLADRVVDLAPQVDTLVLTLWTLPPGPLATGQPHGTPGLREWPGLGRYDTYWPAPEPLVGAPLSDDPWTLSERLLRVHQLCWWGLEAWQAGDSELAENRWRHLFWGADGLGLRELQWVMARVVQQFLAPPAVAERAAPDLVTLSTPAPEASRGALGVRFAVIGDGLLVEAVHPAGPAAGLLWPGDLVVAVAGASLAGLPLEAAGEQCVGAPGETRELWVERDGVVQAVLATAIDPASLR